MREWINVIMKLRFSSPLLKTAIPDVKVVVGAKPHRPVHHIYTGRKIIQQNVFWDLVLSTGNKAGFYWEGFFLLFCY